MYYHYASVEVHLKKWNKDRWIMHTMVISK